MPDGDDLVELIRHAREERNLEYKCGGSWTDLRFRIIKAVLALANIPDGGVVVVGLRKEGETYHPDGVHSADCDTFTQDDVSVLVNEYADPFAEVTVSHVAHEGRQFVVIQVREFEEHPVVCKKDGPGLRRGAIYTRPRRKCESVEVPGHVDLREILDRAVERGMRALLGRVGRSGLLAPEGPASETDTERFDAQARDVET